LARPLRINYEHAFYHITGRGNERKRVFYGSADCAKFKEYLRQAQQRYGFILHAYVLMGNHYHLLGETPLANLSAVMHSVNGAYTTYFNKKRNRSGHLFQGRYKAILIEKDAYLLELSRYIHLNPVKAQMVTAPEDYLWSSYRAYVNADQEDVVSRDLLWSMTSSERKVAPSLYRAFVEQSHEADPFKNLYGGMILGTKTFIRDTLGNLKEATQNEEIASRRHLRSVLTIEDIVVLISKELEIPEDRVAEKGQYRNLAIYITKKRTGFTNKEIGDYFGGITYSSVTRACERLEQRMLTDEALRSRVVKLMARTSQVKG
jgi:putative transposase